MDSEAFDDPLNLSLLNEKDYHKINQNLQAKNNLIFDDSCIDFENLPQVQLETVEVNQETYEDHKPFQRPTRVLEEISPKPMVNRHIVWSEFN